MKIFNDDFKDNFQDNFKGQLLGIFEDDFFLAIYYLGTFSLDQARSNADQLILKTWLNLWCLNPVFDRLIAYSCLLSILLDSYEIKAQQDYLESRDFLDDPCKLEA